VNPALQGYLAAMEESLGAVGALADAGAELYAVADLVEGNNELLLAIDDGSVPVASRRAVLDQLLAGRVRPEVVRLVHQAVTVLPAGEVVASFRWLGGRLDHAATRPAATAAEPFDEELLGRLGSRNRVSGYAAAVFETVTIADLEEIEDQLFRFARTVEANRRLRLALGDRDLPVVVRQEVITRLLDGKVLPATLRLAVYAVRGGRARDIVATLDTLVEDAAKARGWRVARVQAANDVDDAHRRDLSEALAFLTGSPVDLQVIVEPELLGGVVVQVGDLLVDSSTRHRIDELKEHLLASEEAYRIPGSPTRREATDG
jgi:F-type H+-transporting ATPase subunit delta